MKLMNTATMVFFCLLNWTNYLFAADTIPFVITSSDNKQFYCDAIDLAKLSSYWDGLVNGKMLEAHTRTVKSGFSSRVLKMVSDNAKNNSLPNNITFSFINNQQDGEFLEYVRYSGDYLLVKSLVSNSQKQESIPDSWEEILINEIKNKNSIIIETIGSISQSNLFKFLWKRNEVLFLENIVGGDKVEIENLKKIGSILDIIHDNNFLKALSVYGIYYILTSDKISIFDEATLFVLFIKWMKQDENNRKQYFIKFINKFDFSQMANAFLANLIPCIGDTLALDEHDRGLLISEANVGLLLRAVPAKYNLGKININKIMKNTTKRNYVNHGNQAILKCIFSGVASFKENNKYYSAPVTTNGFTIYFFLAMQFANDNNAEKQFAGFLRCVNDELGENYTYDLPISITVKLLEGQEEHNLANNQPLNFTSPERACGFHLKKADGTFVQADADDKLTLIIHINFLDL